MLFLFYTEKTQTPPFIDCHSFIGSTFFYLPLHPFFRRPPSFFRHLPLFFLNKKRLSNSRKIDLWTAKSFWIICPTLLGSSANFADLTYLLLEYSRFFQLLLAVSYNLLKSVLLFLLLAIILFLLAVHM